MAKVVEISDDDSPVHDALLKSTSDKVSILSNPRPAPMDKNSSAPKRPVKTSTECKIGPGLKGNAAIVKGLKNRPKKRVLNQMNDNPLLKPFNSTSGNKIKARNSPVKKNGKLDKRPDSGEGTVPTKVKQVEILDSDEEEQGLAATSASISTKSSCTFSGEGLWEANVQSSTQKLRKNEATKFEYGKELSSELIAPQIPTKPARNVSRVSESATGSRACTGSGKNTDDLGSDSEGLSDFIVGDSTFLYEDDSVIGTPRPRAARRLMRGRRPSNLESSDEELLSGKGDAADARRPSRILRLGRETDLAELSSIARIVEPPSTMKQPGPSNSKATSRSERALFAELESLYLSDNSYQDIKPPKVPSEQKFKTPPGSPILKPIKLQSPTKKFIPIPKSPHRPSMDSFWNSEVINEWNDEYSPQKTPRAPRPNKNELRKDTLLSSPKKSSVNQNRVARDAKRAFSDKKHSLAESFLLELDKTLTQGQISKLSASTGGIKIIWSKKLNTTAGRANWKRETVKSVDPQGISYKHHASIELAEKVINDEERLLNVIAHEFCHLANFMISNVKTNPHGKEFKAWAAKCSAYFGDRGIVVTTKHSYEIDYKYVWECENCGLEFKRHSKSIDPLKHQCGSCKNKLVQTRPVPRADTAAGGIKKVSEYQAFVKENMSRVREENPASPQKDVMGLVAKRYQEYKTTKSKGINIDGPNIGERMSKKEGTPEERDALQNLTRKLDFLDLTSP